MGFCQCGCGERTRIARRSNPRYGQVAGQPVRFCSGHNSRPQPDHSYEIDANGCWIWTGPLHKGYGRFMWSRTRVFAYRWFWERANGPVPDGLELDHVCRVKACVNPDHLEPVTHAENMRRAACTHLTLAQVRQIRSTPKSHGIGRALALQFGVSENVISDVRRGRTWKDAA